MARPWLSKREFEVMQQACEGLDAKSIGRHLGISPRTVEIHRANAMGKLQARNGVHAAVLFDRQKLVLIDNSVLPKDELRLEESSEWTAITDHDRDSDG